MSSPPCPSPLLQRSFGLVPSSHCGAITVFLLGGGAPRGGAAVGGGATAGGGGSVGEGEGEGERQGGVRRCSRRLPIPFLGAQHGRRREGERQRKSSHVEEPADAARHLWRREETT